MVDIDVLRRFISGCHEWLLVNEAGKSFPLFGHEIDVSCEGGKNIFGFIDDGGFHSWRLNGFETHGGEALIDVVGAFARNRETLRLIPRTPAAEIAEAIEKARLKAANDIALLIDQHHTNNKLIRVALNEGGGRFAQIEFTLPDKTPVAAIADVTNKVSVEDIFSLALIWLNKLGLRKKKPIDRLWIVCEKRQAKAAQKLHTLLSDRWKEKLTVFEIDRRHDPAILRELPKRRVSELWRERAPKLSLPVVTQPGETASRIIDLAPRHTDIIFTRQGETLRFNGLPFARVRSMLGVEKAWFGTGSSARPLTNDNDIDLNEMINELELNRTFSSANKRHKLYRLGAEAWLESILRRDIRLLDANLILSPIYNQFRFVRDKIDLLALRRDGRLVIIELKTQPDKKCVLQAADYWGKIELQRRRGVLAAADLFNGREILDKPAIVYLAAPAWSFHRDFEFFAKSIAPEIELWRFELHENWRKKVRVIARHEYR